MSRSIVAQPDVFAAYYLPMCAPKTDLPYVALRARIRRLYAAVTRGV